MAAVLAGVVLGVTASHSAEVSVLCVGGAVGAGGGVWGTEGEPRRE